MTNEDKELKITEVLNTQDVFKLKSVVDINHKPHPYMIGPRHIHYASENHGGMLGNATLKAIPCAYPKCGMPYEDHTSDNVACLQTIKDCTNDEANKALQALVSELGEEFVDGFVFVESEFKITE